MFKKSPYRLCSFMQHYKELSPLIDFTKNPKIALFFALKDENGNIVKMPQKDIAIYELCIDEDDIVDNEIEANNNLKKYIVNRYDYSNNQEGSHYIYIKNAPEFKIFDVDNKNDRMVIQEGVFLFVNTGHIKNGVIVNAKFNKSYAINKYIITKEFIMDNYNLIYDILKDYLHIDDVKSYLDNQRDLCMNSEGIQYEKN